MSNVPTLLIWWQALPGSDGPIYFGNETSRPICGMDVDETTPHQSHQHGQTTYFCSAGCQKQFERRTAPAASEASPAPFQSGGLMLTVIDPPAAPGMAVDPICHMTVDPARARSATRDGKTEYFCSEHCRQVFLGEKPASGSCCPGSATDKTPRARKAFFCPMCPGVESDGPDVCPDCGMALERNPAFRGASLWTCPMHPEIQASAPGSCPKCGMPLEPVQPNDDDDPELRDMTRRFLVAALLSTPLFVLAMGPMLGGHWPEWVTGQFGRLLQFALATPVVLWAGWPFFVRGAKSFVSLRFNMFTLIAIGAAAAYLYSIAALWFPDQFPVSFRHHGVVELYFEAAAVIITLVLLGQVLELRARKKTGSAIRELMALAPATARVVREAGDVDVPLAEVKVGDRLRVRPGEKVPTDGQVVEGRTAIDESMITGESSPVERGPGEPVIGGTLNTTGSVVIEAERIGSETLLSRIVELVAEARMSRAPIQRLADMVAGAFVPAVLVVAAFTFVVWAVWGPEPALTNALVNSVAVLMIACPCALGLATPMSIMVGIGRGAREGILIRNAESLERLEAVRTLVVDKTGTLTEGRPSLRDVVVLSPFTEETVLTLAASLERHSEHPLARAILEGAISRGAAPTSAEDFRSETGSGVSGRVAGQEVRVGNAAWISGQGVPISSASEERIRLIQDRGQTAMTVSIDGRLAGILAVADAVKKTTPEAIRSLHEQGVRIVMLTGDHERTARSVAESLGISEFHAGMRPEEKQQFVRMLRQQRQVVAMAGDGVNDAPALADADVGIAMGTGTDVAIGSAGMTLVKGDLRGIARAVLLSRAVMRNIRQNLVFAFAYNLLGVPIAAGALYPAFGWLLSPMLAAAAMSFSSVSVIANSLRLRRMRLGNAPADPVA